MLRALLLSVRFYDGRYHGVPDWPPSPARLFQALLAGAAQSRTLTDDDKHAFAWLETLTAPVIAAPVMRHGQDFTNYVPNNDLDAVGGDQMRVGKIRAPKPIRPILFDAETPLLYTWTFEEAPKAHRNAQRIRAIAQRLYQLGRGVDMAWAVGEIPRRKCSICSSPRILDRSIAHPRAEAEPRSLARNAGRLRVFSDAMKQLARGSRPSTRPHQQRRNQDARSRSGSPFPSRQSRASRKSHTTARRSGLYSICATLHPWLPSYRGHRRAQPRSSRSCVTQPPHG